MTDPGGPYGVRIVFTLVAAMLVLGACQRANDQHSGEGETSSEDSVLTLTEAFRIGDESASDSVLFGFVFGMAVDSRGHLYITHDRVKRIRKFSKEGILIGEIGREGEGPGEFIDMPDVHLGPGDSLYAWDIFASRLTIFSPQDHSYVTSLRPSSSEDDRLSPNDFLGATDLGLLLQYSRGYSPESDESDINFLRIKLVDWNGAVISDSVAQLSQSNVLVKITEFTISFDALPFGSGARFAVSTDQVLYYGTNAAIHITALPFRGGQQPEFDITVPHTPVPVTQSERQEAIANAREGFQEMIRARLPEVKPAFNTLVPDDEGRLWIELNQQEGEQTSTWLVVDKNGLVVGKTSVPQGVQLRVVRGRRAYGIVTEEETGAPIVVAWDISS